MKLAQLGCLLPLLLTSQSGVAAPESQLGAESDPQAPLEMLVVWGTEVASTQTSIGQQAIHDFDLHNVAEALNTIPGVALNNAGRRNEQQVRVRGFNSRQVPLFFDGIPIYIPYDGNLDLGRFLASDLSSIEVSKGYASLLQGPNMMGGAINLSTSKPKPGLSAHINARNSWTGGKSNAYSLEGAIGGRNELGYVQISGNRLSQDFQGLPHGVDNDKAGHDGKRAYSATHDNRGVIKLGLTPNQSDEYVLTYVSQHGSKDVPPYAGNNPHVKGGHWHWPEYNKDSFYYHGNTKLAERVTLKSRLYHDNFVNTLLMEMGGKAKLASGGGKLPHQSAQKAGGNKPGQSQQQSGHKPGSQGAKPGMMYSHYDDYSNGAGVQLSVGLRQADELAFALHWKDDVHRGQKELSGPYDKYRDRTLSYAAEYQWRIMESLDLVSSISFDQRHSLQAYKHDKTGQLQHYPDNDQHAFNGQIMVRYSLKDGDELQLSYADRSRFPTLKERYSTHKPKDHKQVLPNPHLLPERARNVDLTYRAPIAEQWQLEASAYYNRIADAILSHTVNATTIQNRNSGEVDYFGTDFGLYGELTDGISLGISYSYINSDVQQGDLYVTNLPHHQGFAWLKLQPLPDLTLTVTQEARSQAYSNTDGSQIAAGFAVTGMRVDYQVLDGLQLNASVNNLFDRQYAYSEGYIEQGRNFWLGIEYRFGH